MDNEDSRIKMSLNVIYKLNNMLLIRKFNRISNNGNTNDF